MNTNRTSGLLLAGFTTAFTAGCYSPASAALKGPKAPDKRPNVLFIFADQWRAQAMGYAGDPNVKTPNLDAFARANLNFSNTVSCQPISSPYRASLFTGQFTTTNGEITNGLQLRPNTPTMGELFKAAGYQTGYIGKWHLDGGGLLDYIPAERRFGWDYWRVMNCTHKYTDSYYWGEEPIMEKWPGYDATSQTDTLCTWLGQAAKAGKPFCMVLSWGPPHNPCGLVGEEYKAMYEANKIILRGNVPAGDVEKAKRNLALYYANCTALDDAFGRIVTRLRELGIEDNTVLVFTADHGDMMYSHGFTQKSRPFDESICVPFLMRCPDVKGKVVDEPMSTPDILPTLLEICGIKIPEKVEGRSFYGIMTGKQTSLGECALVKWPAKRAAYDLKEYRAVRTKRYTYVEERTGAWLLFDNLNDPYQLNNLAGKPGYADLQAGLQDKLHRALKETDDTFPGENYYLDKFGLEKGFDRRQQGE